jgi:TFIIF-interacting CTD phosphatase-like protein
MTIWFNQRLSSLTFKKSFNEPLKKLAVVLDLDDTLIRTTHDILEFASPFDFTNDTASLFTYKRPHLDTFLNFVFRCFDVYIWTAGCPSYAQYILENILDPLKHLPVRVLTSLNTVFKLQGCYGDVANTKPLSIITNDLSRIVIIDDKPDSFCCNFDNGYQIVGYQNPDAQFNDDELLKCIVKLESCATAKDVRLCLMVD